MMAQRKPSPPEREDIAGGEKVPAEISPGVWFVLPLSQQMTSCFPLASMAQKNPLEPNAAAMVPDEP